MKKEIKYIIAFGGLLFGGMTNAQIRIANSTTISNAAGSSAFIDASSNPTYNSTTNVGKGLLYPRTDLSTFTAFGGAPIGIPTSYPTYYDGFMVYNTKVGGVAGVGTTQGTLTDGFWYYDNKSGTINGGTWKPLFPASVAAATTISNTSLGNNLSTTVNGVIGAAVPIINSNSATLAGTTLTSSVNGISSSVNLAPAIAAATTNVLSLSGASLTSTVNGVPSSVNLGPAITATTTHTLSMSGNTLTSNVNGSAPTASVITSNALTKPLTNTLRSIVNGVASSPDVSIISNNTLSLAGTTLTSSVNGITSNINLAPLVSSVNIYNSDGTLNSDRMVSTNNKMLWFQNGISNPNNHIAFDINVAVPGSTRLITRGSSSSLIRALINSSRMLDMELLTDGTSRLLSTGSSELFIGTNTSSGPLVFGVGTNRAILATNGNFGIGTTTPSQKLHVIGNILASGTITPDYVFEKYFEGESELNPSYNMKSLDEIEEYTRINKHLPGVPSASDVKEQGGIVLNRAAEINLEKIEELYLHLIELNKKVKSLEERNMQLENLFNNKF